jgi:pimeloyl-ACP methyl ester carboxylesterase
MRRTLLTLVILAIVGGSIAAASARPVVQCNLAAWRVAIPTVYTIRGTVCHPTGKAVATVIWVPGSTYDRDYWDVPRALGLPSVVRQAAEAGFVSIAVDRLGSGQSSRPPNAVMTADANAAALAQVVDVAQPMAASGKVFMVGHSSGSTLMIRTAVRQPKISGIGVTGLLHTPGIGIETFFPMLHDAKDDPKFQGDSSIPSGYVTTIPGVRVLFHDIYGPYGDLRALAFDERHLKDAMPASDSGGFGEEVFGRPLSPRVTVPVLIVVGATDLFSCHPGCPNAQVERQFWPRASDYQLLIVKDTGHVLALQSNARRTNTKIVRWLSQQVDD